MFKRKKKFSKDILRARRLSWITITLILLAGTGAWFWYQTRAASRINTTRDAFSENLIGYWKMDEGTGTSTTADASVSGNNLTMTNMESGDWVAGNRSPYALDFDGSAEYLTIADPSSGNLDFTATQSFTLAGWFSRDTTANNDTLVAKKNTSGGAADPGFLIWVESDNFLNAYISDGTTTANPFVGSPSALADGWHHFALTVDRSSQKMTVYLDGSIGTNASTPISNISAIGSLANALDFRIGAQSDAGDPFDGRIDDVRMYNRAFSADEILGLYRLASPGQTENATLAGHWTFDGGDVSGTTSIDRSGRRNDGVLSGTPVRSAGVLGQAMDFDGVDDHVNITNPSTASLDFGDTADFSVSGWFNRDTFAGDHTILAKRNGQANTDDGYIVYIDDTDDKLHFEVSDTADADEYEVVSTATFTTAGWHHFAVVWDQDSAANTEIYIDGIAGGTDTGTIGNIGDLTEAVDLRIGSESDGGARFDGRLDDIRVYNSALSVAEIGSLARGGQTTVNGELSITTDPTLDGYWTFESVSGGTTSDGSGNGQTGTLSGSPVATPGSLGQAIDFDGVDDYVNVTDSATLDFADGASFSVSGWFNRDTFANDHTILAKKNDQTTNQGYIVWIDGTDDKLYFKISDGTDTYQAASTTTFTAAGWHQFSAIWNDSAGAYIYIDGIFDGSTTTSTASVNSLANALDLRIGAESDGANYFDGKLDDIRVYSRALSAGDVRDIYNLFPKATVNATEGEPLTKSLTGYFKMDEGTGTSTTADASGNGITLTMNNMESEDWVTGQIGPYALDFDGVNEFLSVSEESLEDDRFLNMREGVGGSNYFTLAGWFNRDTFANDHTILAKKNDQTTNQGYIVWIDGTDDKLYFKISDVLDTYQAASTTTFTAAGWHQFAVQWNDSVGMKIYIDGRLDNTNTASTASIGDLDNALDFRIGAQSDAGNPFDGKLDDIRIYQRILSAEEIKKLYFLTAPSEIPDTSLVAHYTFDANDMYGKVMMNRARYGYNGIYTDGDGTDNSTELARTGAAPGLFGQGFRSDGGSQHYFSIGAGNSAFGSFGVDQAVTYSWWINEENGSPGNGVMWDKATGCVGAFFWRNSGFYRGSFTYDDDPTTCTDQVTIVVETPTGVTYPNGWHMLTWVIDRPNTVMNLYVDAALVDTETVNNTYQYVNRTADFTLGGVEWFSSWKGIMDDFRIYNRALSREEIIALYQRIDG